MGSSAKKKREKKKDFQKPKLKVGKTRPRAANQTDTSFRARAIVLNQQLDIDAPSTTDQFTHHVSMLSSRSDSNRKESLSYLTNHIFNNGEAHASSLPTGSLLEKLCPLILDGVSNVRTQLMKVFQALPAVDIQDNIPKILPYIRAGMMHLSKDVRSSSIDLLSLLISIAGQELVSCSGGWYKTLECFATLLSWQSTDVKKWSLSKTGTSDVKFSARLILVLSDFMLTGLRSTIDSPSSHSMALDFPLWQIQNHTISKKSNGFAYLNLFGAPKDEENQMLEDAEDRIRVYNARFRSSFESGIAASRQEGGELGRAAGVLLKTLTTISGG